MITEIMNNSCYKVVCDTCCKNYLIFSKEECSGSPIDYIYSDKNKWAITLFPQKEEKNGKLSWGVGRKHICEKCRIGMPYPTGLTEDGKLVEKPENYGTI